MCWWAQFPVFLMRGMSVWKEYMPEGANAGQSLLCRYNFMGKEYLQQFAWLSKSVGTNETCCYC